MSIRVELVFGGGSHLGRMAARMTVPQVGAHVFLAPKVGEPGETWEVRRVSHLLVGMPGGDWGGEIVVVDVAPVGESGLHPRWWPEGS